MSEYLEKIAAFEFKRDPENGMLIGPSGCHYDTEGEAMYYDQIGLCGCGSPTEVHKFLLDCMAARADNYDNLIDLKKVQKIIEERPDIVAEMVVHFLDSRDLVEHGTSVYGSWPTDRGKQVLEIGVMEEENKYG